MYLFQLISLPTDKYDAIFTFHYVSISTHLDIKICRSIGIYIPLCIYFNPM